MPEENIVDMEGWGTGQCDPPTEEDGEALRENIKKMRQSRLENKQDSIIELLEKLNANVEALVAAELYNAEFQERLMKSLTGESESKALKNSLEQEARMRARDPAWDHMVAEPPEG